MRNVFLLMVCSVLLIVPITAFAENATPFSEWDFDFVDVEISQDPGNLQNMLIEIPILFKGDWDLGTINIYATVWDPDGEKVEHFGSLRDLKIGENKTLTLNHVMTKEGTYNVFVQMTPPAPPYLGHIFDTQLLSLTIEPNGLEEEVGVVGIDAENYISYKLEDPTSVKRFELIHSVINLPEIHSYEKIQVTNSEFVQDFSIDTKDIYLESEFGFAQMSVNLIKEGNLLPFAGAQNSVQDYIKFYKVYDTICDSVDCVVINYSLEDPKDSDEFPYWVLLLFGLVALYLPLKKNKRQFYLFLKKSKKILITLYRFLKNCKKQYGESYVERPPSLETF